MIERIAEMLRAARATNPLNDWLLARMVTVQLIFACFVVVIIK